MTTKSVGGYDEGYRSVPCFWGRSPGSLVEAFEEAHEVTGLVVLDAGAGEGKNAAHLAGRGALVTALEISSAALANARRAWPDVPNITWVHGDIRSYPLKGVPFGLVVAYGLLHCLKEEGEVSAVTSRLMDATAPGGHHIVCSFNSRLQDLSAHRGFEPCLLEHEQLLAFYDGWKLEHVSDRDLHESHPHNNVPHVHSMTRFIAEKRE